MSKIFVELREKSGFSQNQLSIKLGIPRSTICRLEKGERKPSVNVLIKYSEFFGVPMEELAEK